MCGAEVLLLRQSKRYVAFNQFQKLNPHPSIPEPFAYQRAKPQQNDEIYAAVELWVDSSVTAAL